MMNSRLLLFATLLLLTLTSVTAEPLIVNPFVKGSFAEIKSQRQGRPFVLVFWSESCSYCMKELAMFGKLRKRYPEIELVTVATDPFLEVTTVIKYYSAVSWISNKPGCLPSSFQKESMLISTNAGAENYPRHIFSVAIIQKPATWASLKKMN